MNRVYRVWCPLDAGSPSDSDPVSIVGEAPMKITITGITLILCSGILLAGGNSLKSIGAKTAKARYDKTLNDARRTYMKAIEDARKSYSKDLGNSLTKAMRANDLGEANRINAIKKDIEKRSKYVGSYMWYWKENPESMVRLWPDGSATRDDGKPPLGMNWRLHEEHLVIYSSKHQYLFDPVLKNGILVGKGTVPSIRIKLVRK
jgi:hypothetical protein